jgi:DDE family transposase
LILVSDLAATLQTLLTDDAEDAARATGWVRRCRRFSGATLVQTLVLGWLHNPRAPVDGLADVAADLGIDVSPQALDKRFTPAGSHCLARVLTQALHRVVAAQPLALDLLSRFAGVYLYDASTLALPRSLVEQFPGSGQDGDGQRPAALKCQVELELSSGTLDLQIEPARQADVRSELVRRPLPAGALRLADRGYLDLERLADDTTAGVYWISRLRSRMIVAGAGRRGTLAEWLRGCTVECVDAEVEVGSTDRLRCRLLARRVPAAIAKRRREKLRQRAKKQGRKVSADREALCDWNVCITNLPAALLSSAEAWVLLRSRWQIELLFKLWKSHGGLSFSHGQRAARVLCEIYAKLIGMVVQHWLLLASAGSLLGWSWTKAARRVRREAVALGQALQEVEKLIAVLERLGRRIQKRCQRSKRQRQPTTYQRLQDPDGTEYQEVMEYRWEQAA